MCSVGGPNRRHGGRIRTNRPERRRSDTVRRICGLGPRQEPRFRGRHRLRGPLWGVKRGVFGPKAKKGHFIFNFDFVVKIKRIKSNFLQYVFYCLKIQPIASNLW